jgi:catechol 2,3-dioxygenase-like lactoylglutathione lyase family enzyme
MKIHVVLVLLALTTPRQADAAGDGPWAEDLRPTPAVDTRSTVDVGQQQSSPLVPSVRGAFFAVSVADMAASVRWYTEKLGLRIVMEQPKTGKAAATILEGGALTVELVQIDGASPSWRSPEQAQGVFKSGVVVDDLDALVGEFKKRGVQIASGPFLARGQIRSNVIVRDNEGNLIQFFGK